MPLDLTRALRLHGVRAWVASLALMAAISAIFVANRGVLAQRQAPIALTLLMVVLLGVVTGGRRLGLVLALGGFLVINYFFQLPYGSFLVHDPSDWLVLISYVIAADLASRLVARERDRAEEARRRTEEVQRLADVGAETLAAPVSTDALRAIADVIARTLQLDRCEVWDVHGDGAARHLATAPAGAPAPGDDVTLGTRVRVGAATLDATPAERALRFEALLAGAPSETLVPLSAHHVVVGALRLVRRGGLRLDESERTFLQALAHYAALGVERARLAAELRRVELQRQADQMKDFVIATVSHDLRTPLTTIKALAHESARAGDRNAVVIEEQADRLARMVADVLDLSRVRAGVLPISADINTAEDVVGATLRQASGALRGRRVETRLRDDGGPLVGTFDFVATLRILGNLVDNAAKYSPAGEPIVLDVLRDGEELAFTVIDRGPGVAEEERERIFAPFYRAGAAPDVGGTGLGLAVARALAEAQRGSLVYRPAVGGGSAFVLRVPASDDPHALALIDHAAAEG